MKCIDCKFNGANMEPPCCSCDMEHSNFEPCKSAPEGTVAKWKHLDDVVDYAWYRCSYCGRAVKVYDSSQLLTTCRCGAKMKMR